MQGIQGEKGEDGHTPVITIGDNGNWYVDGTDTGIAATGAKGDKGDKGDTGETGAKGDKGDKGDAGESGADGKDGVDGSTPYIGSNGNWWIDGIDTGVLAQGTDGLTPYIGSNGNWFLGNTDTGVIAKANGISKIVLSSTNGKVKTYCIYFTNGSTFTFTVSDGSDGANGKTPYIGSNGNWWIDNTDTNVLAEGTTIVSISLTSSDGNVDTYTIELSNGDKYTFTITNGTNGKDGKDGNTPYIGSNGNWWIGEKDTGVHAQGEKGDTGATGKSAYEIYCEEHPTYTGTEEEWLHSLINGDLADDITIMIDTSGGEVMEPVICRPNSYIEVSEPTRLGFVFDGWYLNGSLIDLNTYIFRTSCTIVAHYRAADIAVTLDPSEGDVVYDTMSIRYGSTYSLPTPTKKHQVFDGWYYGNNKVELSGKWTIKDDCTLVAKWNKKTINVTLSVDSEYGTCTTTSVDLKAGDSFTLPVPNSITDSSFQGWFYGDKQITDATGKSLDILDFDSDVVLTAKFYIEITNIYQILAMSNSESTTGNYKIVNDLDFDGVEMSPIENFSGVFDGGGHTLFNINIINGTGDYGGFFGTVSRTATIKNLMFSKVELAGTWEIAGGLIGATKGEVKTELKNYIYKYTMSDVTYNVNIDNIKFSDSFNSTLNVSDSFGLFIGCYYCDASATTSSSSNYYGYYYYNSTTYSKLLTPIVNLSDAEACDCLRTNNLCSSVCLGQINFSCTYAYYDVEYLKKALMRLMKIDGENGLLNVDGIKLISTSAIDYVQTNGLVSNVKSKVTNGIHLTYEDIKTLMANYKLFNISHIYSNLKGLKYLVTENDSLPFYTTVTQSSNYGQTTYSWGGVDEINNSISTSDSTAWGAKVSNKCIEAGNNEANFSYDTSTAGMAYNCANLIPNESGVYTYYNASGNSGTVSKSSLINKDFFVSMLNFETSIWDFSNLNIVTKKYPTII